MATIKRALPPAPEPTKAYHDKGKPITDIVSVRDELVTIRPKNPRHKSFTNAQKAEIFEMRARGLPYTFIAKKYDTTSDTIRHIVCREKKKRADSVGRTIDSKTKK